MAKASASGSPVRDRVRRFFSSSVGWPFALVVLIVVLWTLWTSSAPGGPGIAGSVAVLLFWTPLLSYWLTRGAALFLVTRTEFAKARTRIRFVAPVVVFVAGFACMSADIPEQLRFELSRSALDSYAADYLAGRADESPTRVGLYWPKEVQSTPYGFRIEVVGAGLLEVYAFAYSPDGPPDDQSVNERYERIEGPWYLWIEAF